MATSNNLRQSADFLYKIQTLLNLTHFRQAGSIVADSKMHSERFGWVKLLVLLTTTLKVLAVDSTPSLFLGNEIKTLLESHNSYRRQVIPQGSNLRLVTWDDNLAGHAQAYSNVCKFAHSPPYSFEPYGNIGENIYITTYNLRVNLDALKRITTAWFNEKRDYNFEGNTCTPKRMCGHYTQVVWDNTYRMGCGITHCAGNVQVRKNTYTKPYIVVCKYGPGGNVRPLFSLKVRRPYKEGEWCSNCPDEAPVCVDKLCHDQNITEGTTTQVHISQSIVTTQTTRTMMTNPIPELRCHVCDGELSADVCLSRNQIKTCSVHSNSTIKISFSNPWNCISFWENNMIKMNCAPKKTCAEMARDKDRKVKCCNKDFCNVGSGAKRNNAGSWTLTIFLSTFLLCLR